MTSRIAVRCERCELPILTPPDRWRPFCGSRCARRARLLAERTAVALAALGDLEAETVAAAPTYRRAAMIDRHERQRAGGAS